MLRLPHRKGAQEAREYVELVYPRLCSLVVCMKDADHGLQVGRPKARIQSRNRNAFKNGGKSGVRVRHRRLLLRTRLGDMDWNMEYWDSEHMQLERERSFGPRRAPQTDE